MIRDLVDRVIKVGDYVVNSHMACASELRIGKVLKLDYSKGTVRVVSAHKVTTCDAPPQTPQAERKYYEKWERYHSAGTFGSGDRLLVLSPEVVPKHIRDILNII